MTSIKKQIKICVVTGTRSEYGLFLPLLKLLQADIDYTLQLLVTGMHLSPEFGLTYKDIENAGFLIDEKVEILLSSDTHIGTIKSMGLGLIGFADSFQRLMPDWVVVLGDRFETFAAATAAYLAKIPLIHLHGGETTEGATDEAFRHAITKMAYLHFASTDVYRKRIIQLGENPSRVFNVGAIGLDNIRQMQLLEKEDLSSAIGFDLMADTYALVTFHPVTLEDNTAEQQFTQLLTALDGQKDLKIVFTLPNADADGRAIIQLINNYVAKNAQKAKAYISLGQLRYLSAVKYADFVIGNSSSGIIEAPSFNIPTVNIGDRQKGRLQSKTVIDTLPNFDAITAAIQKARSVDFKKACLSFNNIYGSGNTAQLILEILKKFQYITTLKKPFYDLPTLSTIL